MSLSVYDIRLPYVVVAKLLAADGIIRKVVYTSTAAPILITDILLTNSDTIDHLVFLDLYSPSVAYQRLGSVNVPARAGYDGILAVNMCDTVLPTRIAGWIFPTGYIMQFGTTVIMTGATVLDINMFGGYC